MATTMKQHCDCCGLVLTAADGDNPLAARLLLVPPDTKRWPGDYQSRLDVGKCCLVKVSSLGKWQKRKKRARVAA